jgi:hypothetical protein
MVYIEDRIADLESAMKELREELIDAKKEIAALTDKKRKVGDLDQEQMQKAFTEMRASVEEKLEKAGVEKVDKSIEEMRVVVTKKVDRELVEKLVTELRQKSEERLAQVLMTVQAATDKKLQGVASRELLMQTVQSLNAANQTMVKRDHLAQALSGIETAVQNKVQQTLNLCQGMLSTNQELFKRMQVAQDGLSGSAAWQDLDLTNSDSFDISKVFRVRIGDGDVSRWLYSTEVSMGQIYTTDNVLDQAIVVNSGSKSSYGARRVGADISTTAYFAVFQLQYR